MTLYQLQIHPELTDPVMVLALSGWVDAGSVGTGAAEHLAALGREIGSFDRDALYDYRANRPVLQFEDGKLQDVTWPSLDLSWVAIDGRDLLVLTGNEPDFRWRELSNDVAGITARFGVRKLITLGGVPAAVPHTLPPTVLATASDADQLTAGDQLIGGTLVVPGAAVSILTDAIERTGIGAVGYWVQVPHYVRERFLSGVLSLVERVGAQLEATLPLGDLATAAVEQRAQLDESVAARPEAAAYVQRLEELTADEPLPSADEIGAEVERFLREATGNEDPFGSSD